MVREDILKKSEEHTCGLTCIVSGLDTGPDFECFAVSGLRNHQHGVLRRFVPLHGTRGGIPRRIPVRIPTSCILSYHDKQSTSVVLVQLH